MNYFRIAYKGESKILKKLCELSNALVDVVSSFDTDGDGVVDNAAKVNGHNVDKDVPADAVFTDTVYDDTELQAVVKKVQETADAATKDIGLEVVDGKLCVVYKV